MSVYPLSARVRKYRFNGMSSLRTAQFPKFGSVGLGQTRILRLSPGHATVDRRPSSLGSRGQSRSARIHLSADVAVSECRRKSDSFADFRWRDTLLEFWTLCGVTCLHVLDELQPLVRPEWPRNLTVDKPR